MPTLNVRHYRPEDLDAVVDVWYRSWNASSPTVPHPMAFQAWAPRFVHELVPKGTIWVAEIEEQVVGFMLFVDRESYIDQLYVDPDFLGQGIGTVLLDLAKAAAPGGVTLHALTHNQRARAFYEKHGFVAGPERVNIVNGQMQVEYRWHPTGG